MLLLQGTKLWIIMEYLGGGSALDLVSYGPWKALAGDLVCEMPVTGHSLATYHLFDSPVPEG